MPQICRYEWTVHSAAWADDWSRNQQTPFNTMGYLDDHGLKAWPPSVRTSPWPKWHGEEASIRPLLFFFFFFCSLHYPALQEEKKKKE
jgi:hypothetical protein